MSQHCDNHIAAELEIFESLLQTRAIILGHERVEEDQIYCDEYLYGCDVWVEINAGFADVKTLEESR